MIACCDKIGVSKKISGVERTRLKVIAKTLQPEGFGLTVRTVAAGHSLEELQKDLESLFSTWKNIIEHAKSAALAADEGVEGAVPVTLHRAMGQTLSVVQDYFNENVSSVTNFMSLSNQFIGCLMVSIYIKKKIQVTFCILITFYCDILQVKKMVVDSPRTFHEVRYQLIAEC